jgi:hypothetical protein
MEDILTDSEKGFLGRHGLSADDVYDARDMSTRFWKVLITEENKTVAGISMPQPRPSSAQPCGSLRTV